jgi:hypothetical protein
VKKMLTAAALLAAAALAVTPAALAKDRDVRVNGSCTGATTSKLKLSEEDGRIEVEFEVDQNRSGVRWQVRLFRNGARVAAVTRTTRPPSGSFEVRRVVGNGPGTDRIRAVAVRASGARCTAQASF